MANDRVFNFSAGPSMLPLEVLQRAGAEITNYGGSGMSVMEMSHRSKIFLKIFDETQEKFRKLLGVPEGYKVLFLQGGGTMQFGMIPPEPHRQNRPGRLCRDRSLCQPGHEGGQEVRSGHHRRLL